MPSEEPQDFSQYPLGQKHELINLERSEEVYQASLALLHLAQRSVIVVSRNLDSRLYNNSEFTSAVRQFALRSQYARVRILVRDSSPAVKSGHRLIELAQRLSSFIEVRVPDIQHSNYNSAFMVVDSTGYLFRDQADMYTAQCSFADRNYSREITRKFDDMWEHAIPDINFRSMLM
jgi:hypothetical protein